MLGSVILYLNVKQQLHKCSLLHTIY